MICFGHSGSVVKDHPKKCSHLTDTLKGDRLVHDFYVNYDSLGAAINNNNATLKCSTCK